MAKGAARALLLAAALAALAAARAARFGDRLAPRVPAAYAPRSAPTERHDASREHEHEHEQYEPPARDGAAQHTEPAPRRAARTEAHRLELSTEYFVLPERVSPSSPASVPSTGASTPRPNATVVPIPSPPAAGSLRPESWAVPVLALACVSMVSLGGFEAFVIWGARRQAPSQRHLLLGQSLLFGLFACAATAALLAITPSAFACGAVRFGAGVAYVIVFASLLVKCVFLLSLNGGVYLPAAYQGLLLFFAVMVQVAIGAQWLGGSPPRAVGGRCAAPLSELLLSLCYAATLIAAVCGVALRSRGVRDNDCEATHIAGAGGAAAAVWACWVAAALGAPAAHRDACVAAGLLATCAVVFALMFAPRGRRLAALGREPRWGTEHDDGLSSLGAGGSGYSPSFFHFKPVKYGMVCAAAAPAALERKEPPAQPADVYAAMFPSPPHAPPHLHPRAAHCPPHYPPHPLMHYHYNYPPYPYLLPPGVMVRPEEGNVYTSVEPTFSSNPNVYFQRTEALHVGMMY